MLQKQSPTPSMKQRSRSYSPLSAPSAPLTISQTQREGGERQCFRNLSKDEQTHDEGRLPGCYPAVSFPGGLLHPFPPSSNPFAVHRNVVKAIQTSTTDSGGMAQPNGSRHDSPSIKRSSTSGSNRSVDSTKKKSSFFGIRKSASKHSNHGT